MKIMMVPEVKGNLVRRYKIGPPNASPRKMALFLPHLSDSQPPNKVPRIPPLLIKPINMTE